MTERSESERAELVAIAGQIDIFIKYGTNAIFEPDDAKKIASALRRLAAQDQKSAMWRYRYSHWPEPDYWSATSGDPSRFLNQSGLVYEPLYIAPPTAAGWDQAIEAAKNVAKDMRDKYGSAVGDQYSCGVWDQSQRIIGKIEALRHNAPPDSGAGKSDDVTRATAYAESLAVALWEKFDKSEAPQWKPLSGDLIGLLTQIDNMTTGLVPDHGGADAGGRMAGFTIRAALDQAIASLNEIAGSHVPDCPSHYEGNELAWAQRHVAHLRRKAEIVRDGIKAALSHQPAPVAANASAEARLRIIDECSDALGYRREYLRSLLSTHPHASDCDKQGER